MASLFRRLITRSYSQTSSSVSQMESYLALHEVSKDCYQNSTQLKVPWNGRGVFGGTLVAQSLHAAHLTAGEKFRPLSIHSNFLVAAQTDTPLLYQVERIRDSKNYCTRQVRTIQNGQVVFMAMVSFEAKTLEGSAGKAGPQFDDHRAPPVVGKDVPPLEECFDEHKAFGNWIDQLSEYRPKATLATQDQIVAGYGDEPCTWKLPQDVFDLDHVDPKEYDLTPTERAVTYWVKARGTIQDASFHQKAIAYISDYFYLTLNMRLHMRPMFSTKFAVSLDHTVYFHEDVKADDWMTFSIKLRSCERGKALLIGDLHSKDGKLAATVIQQGMSMHSEKPKL
ncbi:unnamed protein product [Kuraishia capsulata CBS 1993]|uniref:Acyl-CoA thioesterase II n=1 Tax=Kuraishia capsulata CBS 1993 TaxID=1382522 RepID=W6MH16_9ASCO|nr:uncharacterized protein KUCA_T00001193001 [Kuraishia capsulata CBS 1993]CDK25226.1 unnamed protein product [Kuraishia capsulata CBS 1993]